MLDNTITDILKKPGNEWTQLERALIAGLVKDGKRAELKAAREKL